LIPKIEIPAIGVEPVKTYLIQAPVINAPNVPINVPIGFPIIEMPCVKARKSIENDALLDNDPDGNMILCPAQTPSYEPMKSQKSLQQQKCQNNSQKSVLPMVRLRSEQK
jgi:hypothetical protein